MTARHDSPVASANPGGARDESPDHIDRPLEEWVTEQRWFASKAREVASVNVLARVELSSSPALALELVETRFQAGTHELYQLLAGEDEGLRALAAMLGSEATVDGVAFHGGSGADR